jgi:ATP-dependent helicase/DNAse subunit B
MLVYRHSDRKISYAGAYSYVFNEGRIAKGIFTRSLYKRVKPVADSEIDKLLKETEMKVAELLRQIYAGDFSLNPYDIKERCRQGKCPYYELCRIDNRLTEATIDMDE